MAAPSPAQQVTWTALAPSVTPPTTSGFAYASSPEGGWLFSGSATGGSNELWLFNGTNWINRTPAGSNPVSRVASAMVFDSARDRLVLFGGSDSSGFLADTWAFSLATSTWTQLSPAGAPSPREGHAMCYDSARDRIVLVGGLGAAGIAADTFEFDGTDWATAVAPPGTGQFDAAMVFDDRRDRCVLVGGAIAPTADVLEFDGTAWFTITPAGPAPAPRSGHSMVFDPVRARAVLFGGSVAGIGVVNDAWEWNGTAWMPDPATALPPAHGAGALLFVPSQRRTIAYGGPSSTTARTSNFPTEFFESTPTTCGGLAGMPVLVVEQFPWRSDDFVVRLDNVPDGAVATLNLDPFTWSTAPTPTPVALPFLGCTLFATGVFTFPQPAGVFTWTIPISGDPVWIGFEMVLQAVAIEPVAGFVMSGAVSTQVGDR